MKPVRSVRYLSGTARAIIAYNSGFVKRKNEKNAKGYI
jgi:hypothetical protein